jgi:hypothetical protein
LFNFLVHEYTFQSIFSPKKIPEENCPKIKVRIRTFSKVGSDPVKNRSDPKNWCEASFRMWVRIQAHLEIEINPFFSISMHLQYEMACKM